MLLVRYGLGGLMVIGGVVVLIISPAGLGFDGFAMAVGGGLSVVLFNVLFRLGLSSEADRDEEEQARTYFDAHGEWPEDKPREGRRWILPAGVVTYEQEQTRSSRPPVARAPATRPDAMRTPSHGRRGAHLSAELSSWPRPARRRPHARGTSSGAPRRSLLERMRSALRRH